MAASTILAVDVGRYKSVACVNDTATREDTFPTLVTTSADVDQLPARQTGAEVVGEACAIAWWAVRPDGGRRDRVGGGRPRKPQVRRPGR